MSEPQFAFSLIFYGVHVSMELKDSNTLQNLKDAFAGESQANRRYLYFAAKADVEGENDVAAVFRSTAEGETGHAHGHLEYMEAVGDPATGCTVRVLAAEPSKGPPVRPFPVVIAFGTFRTCN